MKKLILLMLVTSSIFANTLSEKQESEVLTAIDNICGDTWCEGDFNFSFNLFVCDENTNSCVLQADLIVYDYSGEVESEKRFPQSCIVKGYTNFNQMVEESRWGYDLQWPFYEAVTDCVTEMEEAVYQVWE